MNFCQKFIVTITFFKNGKIVCKIVKNVEDHQKVESNFLVINPNQNSYLGIFFRNFPVIIKFFKNLKKLNKKIGEIVKKWNEIFLLIKSNSN